MPRFLVPLLLVVALALVAAFVWSSGDPAAPKPESDTDTAAPAATSAPTVAPTEAAADVALRTRAPAATPVGEPTNPAVAEAATHAALEVHVFAPDGTPAADAEVFVTEVADRGYAFFDGGFGARRRAAGRARTDGEGFARIDVAVARGFDLAVRKDGYASCTKRDVRGGTTVRIDLAFDAEITGRVYDVATNEPLAGATVELRPGRAARTPWTGRPDEVVTGADGTYRFTGVAPGAIDLAATHDRASMGWPLEVEVHPGERVVRDIGLEPGSTITGFVRDAATKAPLANAVLSIRHEVSALDEVRTDATGRYVYADFPRHAYELSAHASGYASQRKRVRRMPDEDASSEVDFELPTERRARGTIVDPDGNPLPGTYVAAAACDDGGENQLLRVEWNRAATDKGGYFEIGHIHPAMSPVLVVHHEGFATSVFDFPKGDLPDIDFGTIVLRRGAVVEAEIVDEHGAPRGDLEISLAGTNSDRSRFAPEAQANPLLDSYIATRTVRSDVAGIALFRDVAAGAYEVRAEVPGTHRTASEPFTVKAGDLALRVRLVVARGLDLRGRVRPSDDGALPKVYVSVDPMDGQGTSGDAECDAEGKFVASGLAPGRYRLSAYPYASDADKRVGRKFEPVTKDDVMIGPEEIEIVIPARIEKD